MSHPRNDCDADAEMSTIFRPPLIRTGTAAFDRALFSKTVDLAAAAVQENKFISQYRKSLQAGKELLHADRISPVAPHPDKALADKGRRCFLLNPSVKPGGSISRRRLVSRAWMLIDLCYHSPRHLGPCAQRWRPETGVDGDPLCATARLRLLEFPYERSPCPYLNSLKI